MAQLPDHGADPRHVALSRSDRRPGPGCHREIPEEVMLGMDAARPTSWRRCGGAPVHGFLLVEFTEMMKERSVTDAQGNESFVRTPASADACRDPVES